MKRIKPEKGETSNGEHKGNTPKKPNQKRESSGYSEHTSKRRGLALDRKVRKKKWKKKGWGTDWERATAKTETSANLRKKGEKSKS